MLLPTTRHTVIFSPPAVVVRLRPLGPPKWRHGRGEAVKNTPSKYGAHIVAVPFTGSIHLVSAEHRLMSRQLARVTAERLMISERLALLPHAHPIVKLVLVVNPVNDIVAGKLETSRTCADSGSAQNVEDSRTALSVATQRVIKGLVLLEVTFTRIVLRSMSTTQTVGIEAFDACASQKRGIRVQFLTHTLVPKTVTVA